ncbi:MAG: glycoside hydrolase family 97 protein [Woeseiaceae bacterium]|nr:glycoside hydrolase family 97 protein [Woeseiaceae bacterium]
MRSRLRTALATLVIACLLPLIADAASVQSPDGRIRVDVDVNERGEPFYSVSYRSATVIGASRLGLRFRDHAGLDSGLRIADTGQRVSDNTWEQPWGERRRVRDAYRELTVQFVASDPARGFAVVFRAYNDGVGFRYEFSDQRYYRDVAITDELTEFRVATDATAWWIPGRAWNRYEFVHHESGLDAILLAHTPMTLKLRNGVHIALHEAALVDYPAYVLDQRRDGVLKTDLTPWSDGVRAYKATPFNTPWRTIQVSPDAVGLLNSDLILNLNEPNKLGDVSWVEPGKYVGIWWAMHLGLATWGSGLTHGATTEEAKRYIDFAAEHGFAGVLVEGWNKGWDGDWFASGAGFSFTEAYPDFDIEAVAKYALARGVRLVGHHETSGHVTNYEQQLDAALDFYERLGVRQVKTGYVADGKGLERVDEDGITRFEWHDGQYGVNHYQRVTEAAAKRRISINSHEPIKATGLRRTWPNWISREGARGQEYNAEWAIPNPPNHTVTLPYTRLLGGPMDYTPGIFDLLHQGPESQHRVQSTLMQQLALYVVLYSPIQMAADLPENYERFPDAFQFIVDVPTDWEESRALAGDVGDYVIFARRERGGRDWYLGAITNEQARSVKLPLDFLRDGTRYRATVYRDGDGADWKSNPYDYVIETLDVDSSDAIELELAAGGGAAIRFRAVQ